MCLDAYAERETRALSRINRLRENGLSPAGNRATKPGEKLVNNVTPRDKPPGRVALYEKVSRNAVVKF